MCQLDSIGTALEGLPECDSAHGLSLENMILKKTGRQQGQGSQTVGLILIFPGLKCKTEKTYIS